MARHFPTDKEDKHNYTLYYDILFEPYLRKDISILEIGVKKGGSLKLWRELFSDHSYVYGIDIDPAVPTFVRDGHIKTLAMDSQETDLVKKSSPRINLRYYSRRRKPRTRSTGQNIWDSLSIFENHRSLCD